MSDDLNLENAGPGWYEVIHPGNATTRIVLVHEDGSLYVPEGSQAIGPQEFHFAAARGHAYRLVRADHVRPIRDRLVASEAALEAVKVTRAFEHKFNAWQRRMVEAERQREEPPRPQYVTGIDLHRLSEDLAAAQRFALRQTYFVGGRAHGKQHLIDLMQTASTLFEPRLTYDVQLTDPEPGWWAAQLEWTCK